MANPFAGVGKSAGVTAWRVEALAPVPNAPAAKGSLYDGDAYIFLHTKVAKGGGFTYNLHFWLGANSSTDEQGAAVRALSAAAQSRGTRAAARGRARGAPRRTRQPQLGRRRETDRVGTTPARTRADRAARVRRLLRARALWKRQLSRRPLRSPVAVG